MQPQRQTTFERMNEETPRKSKGDNVMSGTIAIHNDNISKLNVMSKLDEHKKWKSRVKMKEVLGLD